VADSGGRDFFISYTAVNRSWAEWIAVQLEAAGYSTVLQAWDFRPGSDFIHEMQQVFAAMGPLLTELDPDRIYFNLPLAEPGQPDPMTEDLRALVSELTPSGSSYQCSPPGGPRPREQTGAAVGGGAAQHRHPRRMAGPRRPQEQRHRAGPQSCPERPPASAITTGGGSRASCASPVITAGGLCRSLVRPGQVGSDDERIGPTGPTGLIREQGAIWRRPPLPRPRPAPPQPPLS
jgi:hypothetical protein